MVRVAAVAAAVALACASSGEAFAFGPSAVPTQRRAALRPERLWRGATAAHGRPRLQLGRLQAQLRPEDEKMKSAQPKELGDAWHAFVSTAKEGWASGAEDRASASLPNVFFVPVWVGVAAMGLFLPAPQLLESMFMGMNHGVETANAVDLSSAMQSVQAVAAAGAKGSANVFGNLQGGLDLQQLSNPSLDPSMFVPVCQFSDGFYRTAQGLVYKAAGKATYQEYSPLIAGSLLRVRLEFCVLESFVYESILPFVKARGLSWVFPLKETLETFVAGTVFAVATNLVLIGSTKIITIVVSYVDFFVGWPLRLVFGFTADRLKGIGADKNVLAPLYVGTTGLKVVGQGFGALRR